jgi:hypothetical protein
MFHKRYKFGFLPSDADWENQVLTNPGSSRYRTDLCHECGARISIKVRWYRD